MRQCESLTLTLDTTLADTPVIPFGSWGSGVIYIDATHATTSLQFYASSTADGTFLAVGGAVTVAQPAAYAFGKGAADAEADIDGRFLKIVPNADDGEDFRIDLFTI